MEKFSKIGIYGGSFDPIHFGHLRFAEISREIFGLEKVFFVPTYTLPHKYKFKVSDFKLRVRMLNLAISNNNEYFEVSEIESKRKEKSYTIDTLKEFSKLFPEKKIFFLMGSDSFLKIETWKEWKRLLNEYSQIIAVRPGADFSQVKKLIKKIRLKYSVIKREKTNEFEKINILIDSTILDISSTEIRKRIAEGLSARYLIPENVYALINKENFYKEEKFGKNR